MINTTVCTDRTIEGALKANRVRCLVQSFNIQYTTDEINSILKHLYDETIFGPTSLPFSSKDCSVCKKQVRLCLGHFAVFKHHETYRYVLVPFRRKIKQLMRTHGEWKIHWSGHIEMIKHSAGIVAELRRIRQHLTDKLFSQFQFEEWTSVYVVTPPLNSRFDYMNKAHRNGHPNMRNCNNTERPSKHCMFSSIILAALQNKPIAVVHELIFQVLYCKSHKASTITNSSSGHGGGGSGDFKHADGGNMLIVTLLVAKYGYLRRKNTGTKANQSIRAVLVGDPRIKVGELACTPQAKEYFRDASFLLLNRQPTQRSTGMSRVSLSACYDKSEYVFGINPLMAYFVDGDFDGDEGQIIAPYDNPEISVAQKAFMHAELQSPRQAVFNRTKNYPLTLTYNICSRGSTFLRTTRLSRWPKRFGRA